MFAKAIVYSGLAAVASSHIIMTNPMPFGKSSLSNSPLAADGSDFPCKQRGGVYEPEGASNVYAQGSKQQLEFQGSAVHGGGSCQVSVTTDLKPTKQSVWKVIKSIEGGCPAKDQVGNLPGGAQSAVPYKYDFTIPEELAAGNYTLAWTWFNKVGNREMYMNCAPLAVTGNSGTQSFLNGLPDMMVSNIGGSSCKNAEGKDVQFPFPGTDVDRFNGKTTVFAAPTGSCGKAGSGGGAPAPSSPAGASTTKSTPSAQSTSSKPSSPVPTKSASIPGGVFITTQDSLPEPTQVTRVPGAGNSSIPASSSRISTPTSTPTKPNTGVSPSSVDRQPPASIPTEGSDGSDGSDGSNGSDSPDGPSGPSVPSGPSGAHAPGSPCTPEGQWNCIDGQSFQRCGSGIWSFTQGMAAGVSCETGESVVIKMAATPGKRAMRRALRIRD